MPNGDAMLQGHLKVLRESFRGQIDGRVAAISEQMARLRAPADGDRGEVSSELRHLSHKLSGTAGTFGFTEVGDAAAAIEAVCDGYLADGVELGDDFVAEIDALFETLVSAAAAATGSTPT